MGKPFTEIVQILVDTGTTSFWYRKTSELYLSPVRSLRSYLHLFPFRRALVFILNLASPICPLHIFFSVVDGKRSEFR